jgi:drug/metabolite transporter (DMT)-like permease
MVQSWLYGPTVAAYGLATGTLVPNAATLWGVLAGVIVYAGFYHFARSLEFGRVSIHAPIFRLSFTVTAALAVLLLDELLGAAKLAGLAAALLAVWLLLGGGGASAQPHRASVVRVLLATACVGVGNLIYKIGLNAGATPARLSRPGRAVLGAQGLRYRRRRRGARRAGGKLGAAQFSLMPAADTTCFHFARSATISAV